MKKFPKAAKDPNSRLRQAEDDGGVKCLKHTLFILCLYDRGIYVFINTNFLCRITQYPAR